MMMRFGLLTLKNNDENPVTRISTKKYIIPSLLPQAIQTDSFATANISHKSVAFFFHLEDTDCSLYSEEMMTTRGFLPNGLFK
jgi:hypothetical protein